MWSAAYSLVQYTEFIDWSTFPAYIHHVSIFEPALWSILSGYCSHVFGCQSTVCTDSVWLGGMGGGGVLSRVEDHILREFYTMYLTKFRTYKICSTTPWQYPRRRRGLRHINTCHKEPFMKPEFQSLNLAGEGLSGLRSYRPARLHSSDGPVCL